MSKFPAGSGLFGQVRWGDETSAGLVPHARSLGISYSIIQSFHAVSLGISYSIQKPIGVSLLIYYLVTPTPIFAINGTPILAPDQMTYIPRPVSSRTLLAAPLLQGYKTMTWVWTSLLEQEAQTLLAFYNPLNPSILLTYPDETGTWVQRQVFMLPPVYGSRETVMVSGLSFTFTGLLS